MAGSSDPRLLSRFDYAAFGRGVELRVRDDNNDSATDVAALMRLASAQADEISLAESEFLRELADRAGIAAR